jgi:hypothetical protein
LGVVGAGVRQDRHSFGGVHSLPGAFDLGECCITPQRPISR